MRWLMGVGAVLVATTVIGCSNAPVSQGTAPTATAATTARSVTPSPMPAPIAQVGQTVSNRGVTLTVKAARAAAASWLSEPDGGDQLAHALLAATCTTEVTAEHAYLALITPPENPEDHSEGLPS